MVNYLNKNNLRKWFRRLFYKSNTISTNEDYITKVNKESERILKELK